MNPSRPFGKRKQAGRQASPSLELRLENFQMQLQGIHSKTIGLLLRRSKIIIDLKALRSIEDPGDLYLALHPLIDGEILSRSD